MSNLPATLFKYEPLSLQAIQNIKCHSIHFGSPSRFNDPFDCALMPRFSAPTDIKANAILAQFIVDPETPPELKASLGSMPTDRLKQILLKNADDLVREQRDEVSKKYGISCFSEVNDNLLMWSHYGGQHRGFCLEFNTNFELFTKARRVTYSTEIPEIDIADAMLSGSFDNIFNLFCTKSSDWSYEREWRVIHRIVDTVFIYSAESLKAVYFGAMMTDQDIDMLCLILSCQNPNVQLYRGRRSETQFKIVFDHFTYTTYADAKKAGLV